MPHPDPMGRGGTSPQFDLLPARQVGLNNARDRVRLAGEAIAPPAHLAVVTAATELHGNEHILHGLADAAEAPVRREVKVGDLDPLHRHVAGVRGLDLDDVTRLQLPVEGQQAQDVVVVAGVPDLREARVCHERALLGDGRVNEHGAVRAAQVLHDRTLAGHGEDGGNLLRGEPVGGEGGEVLVHRVLRGGGRGGRGVDDVGKDLKGFRHDVLLDKWGQSE